MADWRRRVTLRDAFAALVADRPQLAGLCPPLCRLPVRNSGTLGGNVANGSPIGDSMPLLIALGAKRAVLRARAAIARCRLEDALHRLPQERDGAKDEVLAWIKVPKATGRGVRAEVYKSFQTLRRRYLRRLPGHQPAAGSRRKVTQSVHRRRRCGRHAGARRQDAGRSRLLGQPAGHRPPCKPGHGAGARRVLSRSSDMRASGAYRSVEVLGNLLQRFWLESPGSAADQPGSPSGWKKNRKPAHERF